ncbi:MAG: serpin family protein [Clostridiales bacterium]|nr:serpin family protein [Clostridiales bacterium]
MKMRKIVTGLLTTSMLLSMGTGCAKKSSTGRSAFGRNNNASNNLPGPATVERKNGQEAVFELASAMIGKENKSQDELNRAYSKFIFEMMKRCAQDANGRNVLISPDSVLFALDMTAGGANGNTLNEMLNVMVPGADNQTAFAYGVNRMNSLQNNSLCLANSVWINQNKADSVYDDFLKFVRENFDAEVGTLEFNQSAVDTINKWVETQTKDRIHDLIEQLTDNDLMVLVNAIAFDGTWETKYSEDDVYESYFRNANGEDQKVWFLSSEESTYLSTDKASGFLKYYDDGKYAFMTILPEDENVDINEFMANLSSDEYWEFWDSQEDSMEVHARFPEFQSEYDIHLPSVLIDMGMKDAFSETAADFSNMTSKDVYISDVIHKTFINVNRDGTTAAAATAVIMTEKCIEEPDNARYVICDRPFAYAIVDVDTGLPVFLGTVENV